MKHWWVDTYLAAGWDPVELMRILQWAREAMPDIRSEIEDRLVALDVVLSQMAV